MGTGMTMVTKADMPTELLQLIWLASPALPVGGFSYSEGLEAAIDHGWVHDEASCAEWISDQLHLSQARGDMALMAQAIPAWQHMQRERLMALSAWVHASRETQEMRLQTEQMGRSLLDWLRNQGKASAPALDLCNQLQPTYPLSINVHFLAIFWNKRRNALTISTNLLVIKGLMRGIRMIQQILSVLQSLLSLNQKLILY